MYKALVFDLDGTLLVGEDLPEANRKALARASERGYHIIIATARWLHMASRIATQIGVIDPMIACSGAQVHNPVQGVDIFDERLPAAFTEELFAMCNNNRCIATITFGEKVRLKLDGKPDPSIMGEEMEWVPQLAYDATDRPRIAAVQGSALCAEIKRTLGQKYADQVNIFDSIGPTGKLVITITAKVATKGAAVQAACKFLNIDPSQTIAFGDAENDLAMFAACGASVAMGQASAEVRNAATIVTAPNDQDGVAIAVNRLLETGSLE